MKTRKYFVSNSSSSSFVCEICGEERSGMDMCLSDADMVECQNGHTICEEHVLNREEKPEPTVEEARTKYKAWCKEENWRKGYLDDLELDDDEFMAVYEDFINDYESDNGISEESCPICQFKISTTGDAASYLLKQLGMTKEQFAEKLKNEFGDYKKFKEYLKG
jgi:hypothetical protein